MNITITYPNGSIESSTLSYVDAKAGVGVFVERLKTAFLVSHLANKLFDKGHTIRLGRPKTPVYVRKA